MRWILICASMFGATAIIMGASLRHMSGMDSEVLQTALRYHQLHSFALLVLGLYALDKPLSKTIAISAILFIAGIIIFSGSLYLSEILSWPQFGMLTPLGGLSFIAAWISLAFIRKA